MSNDVKASNDYPYSTYIKSPEQLGASSKGNLTALGKDIKAMGSYVDVLMKGRSNAIVGGGPMGNKYFLNTNGTCTDATGKSQTRYVYINNIPSGSREGLVPGILENLMYVNPSKIFSAFSEKTNCQQITMDVKDISNNVTTQSQYVIDSDIKEYNPCWFKNKINPVTKKKCSTREGMCVHDNPSIQLYKMTLSILGLFILYSLLKKS